MASMGRDRDRPLTPAEEGNGPEGRGCREMYPEIEHHLRAPPHVGGRIVPRGS